MLQSEIKEVVASLWHEGAVSRVERYCRTVE
jgi:hypothetical protein